MSNNKQSIKLYTEEQVRMLDINCGNSTLDEVIGCLTPIELPSNEEIEKQNPFVFGSHVFGTRDLLIWEQGAEWMRDKIQGGNK